MPPSPTVNVVRYSALTFGVIYGIVHRRTLQHREDHRRQVHEEHKREEWTRKAKEAWAKKVSEAKGSDGVISDPENPAFDLEAYLNKVASDNS